MTMRATAFGAAVLAAACAAGADVVTDWNGILVQTIREVGGPPCPMTRAAAMMHVAMYDAVNSLDRTHRPYLVSLDAPAGTSAEAAAAAAAHRVLTELYPDRTPVYDAALASSLASVPDGPAEADGVALGRAVADAIIAERANDGTQGGDPLYEYGTGPGEYRPTFPDFTSPPANPGWGTTRPWTMFEPSQFRAPGPHHHRGLRSLLRSRAYAEELELVRVLGARDSAVRTPEETQLAFFWAVDANGTMKPPGQLNLITAGIAADRRLSLAENARLFALVNLALADSGLACWHSKYDAGMDLWRPITAIREAEADGNHRTEPDPEWLPLAPRTPPFPAYTSGHAAFAGAHAAVMTAFLGTDEVTFVAPSDDPGYTGGPRTYHSLWDAAVENAWSRVWLGVHYLFDCEDGLELGRKVGEHVAAHSLRPACRADMNGDEALSGADVAEFLGAYRAGQAAADLDGDGSVTPHDWRAFMELFRSGCP